MRDGTNRSDIHPGLVVAITLKKDQGTNRVVQGFVQDILTSKAHHSRGIKVRLTTGEVGRVRVIVD
ncbi:YwbE family protein [Patescibacteria group bacterium]